MGGASAGRGRAGSAASRGLPGLGSQGAGRGRAGLGAGRSMPGLGSQGAGRGMPPLGSEDKAGSQAVVQEGAMRRDNKKAQDTGDSIDWTDANTTLICSLFAKQVIKGNWPNTHL
ncbi:unnamed protein product, partial [Urochloa humidicola]